MIEIVIKTKTLIVSISLIFIIHPNKELVDSELERKTWVSDMRIIILKIVNIVATIFRTTGFT